jgi:hypothetical protein
MGQGSPGVRIRLRPASINAGDPDAVTSIAVDTSGLDLDNEVSSSSSASNGRNIIPLNLTPKVLTSDRAKQAVLELDDENIGVVEAALQVLVNLSSNAGNHSSIIRAGAIEKLIQFISHSNEVHQMYAMLALANLATNGKISCTSTEE